jgi:hypothetical protein
MRVAPDDTVWIGGNQKIIQGFKNGDYVARLIIMDIMVSFFPLLSVATAIFGLLARTIRLSIGKIQSV